MNDVSRSNFGLLIAYLLPGFVGLWGLGLHSPTVQAWIGADPTQSPTLGGFLYVTVGSVAVGLTVSTIRWIVLDALHHVTGIRQPHWDFSRLQEKVAAFDVLIEIHYRYYQFYANMMIALAFSYGVWRMQVEGRPLGWLDGCFLLLELVLFLGSRDTLRLCGRPHKRSYVATLLMWPSAFVAERSAPSGGCDLG